MSLTFATSFGVWSNEYHALWIVYGLYALGAFWIAWRRALVSFSWIGCGLLLFALAHNLGNWFSFPWQTALFVHATICAAAAIVASRYKSGKVLSGALNYSALITLGLGMLSLFQTNPWQVTAMQAQRMFWIAGILLLSLWLNRRRVFFHAFQIALTAGFILTVKAALQEHEWYSYLPHAFLHPSALQIQGTVLTLLCLAWVTLRLVVRRALPEQSGPESWLTAAWRLLDTKFSIDRILIWVLAGGMLLLGIYGALSGVIYELAKWGPYDGYNIADFPHEEALGLGSWIVWGLLTIVMLANFMERRRTRYLLGVVAVFSAIIPLSAGQFESQIATATAWRWLAAIFLLGGSLLIWFRTRISPRLKPVRTLLIAVTVVPIVLLTIQAMLHNVFYIPVRNPASGVFSLIDPVLSYTFPFLVVMFVMVGNALRERKPSFTFAAGVFFNAIVTVTYLLLVLAVDAPMDQVVLVRVMQLNAIACAVYILPWLGTRHSWQPFLNKGQARLANNLLKLQVGIAVVLNVVLILPVVFTLITKPGTVASATIATGGLLGWLTLLAIVVAVTWLAAGRIIKLHAVALASVLLTSSCLIAFGVCDISGWFGLHTLTVCLAISAWVMLIAGDVGQASRCRKLAAIVGGLAVFLSLRTLTEVDLNAWWSVGPLLAITALAATLNWKTQRRRYLYAAGILFNLAVSLWWIFISPFMRPLSDFLLTNLIAGSLAAILWLWLELRARQRRDAAFNSSASFHNIVAILSLTLLGLFVIASFLVEPSRSPLLNSVELSSYAFASVLALMTACLWDQHAKYAVGGLYVLGLIAVATVVLLFGFTRESLAWSFAMLLSVYTLICAILWRERAALMSFAREIGIAPRLRPETTELNWLSAFMIAAVTTIAALVYWIVVTSGVFEVRIEVALALTAQVLTLTVLAEGASEQRWRRAALAVLVLGMMFCGWSWLTPGVDATWLNRSVILMLLAFGLTALYGLFLNKANVRLPEWTRATKSCVPWLLGAGAVALFFCLGTEIFYQISFGAVRIHPLSLVAVGLTLIAATVICVLFALSPSHDPLSLSERGRTRYIYAAEVMLALLFLHVRLTMPWLFTGFFERYWPLVIMSIAYFGVIASEALRRRKLFVLAHPVERTGAFLPLIPVLGFWVTSPEVDFSLVLFVVGGLYGLLSILRRSFLFGVLAAIAGNGGLWYVFDRTAEYQFLQHPQLWLIPVAVSVLIAAYLNEDKLTEDQMTGVRYLSLVTIYVSSTADIFINGVADSPWLPLILGSFSLAGVFAGIVFRIRGLLLLGSVFLLLSIVTMIWYASANFGWTWLWYVAGIMTGATIIFMFAVFEKKRSEVLRVVDGLKEWDR